MAGLVFKDLNEKITNIECIGENFRKTFVIQNNSPSSQAGILKLTQSGTAFSLYPDGGSSLPFDLQTGRSFAFSIDFNGSLNGIGATLSILSNTILNENYYTILSPTDVITLTANNPAAKTKREIGSILLTDEDGEPIVKTVDNSFTQYDTSFGLARTNPKHTGNVRITVDSDNSIWLNSIDAAQELSDEKFKKYRLSSDSSYAIDLKNFFDGGTTPKELVFSLYQEDNQYTSTKRSYDLQYDRFYQYGVEALNSRFYDEDFSFFAPLYLKDNIPEYFVIFRTDGPINEFSYDNLPVSEWPSKLTAEILDKSTIIKTFSLKEDSQIGKYLRNIVNHPSRKNDEITVSFQKDGYTSFNGISYVNGSFIASGELLNDYYNDDNVLMDVEEYLTQGFERNGVVSSHIINLEFLFDDDEVDNYSINRYFGLYVNAVELAKFTVNHYGFVKYSSEIGQTPFPRKDIDATETSLAPFYQTNEDGIKIYVDVDSLETPLTDKIFTSIISDVTVGGTVTLPGNLESKISIGDTCVMQSTVGTTGSFTVDSVLYEDNITTITFDPTAFTGPFSPSVGITLDFYTEQKFQDFQLLSFDNQFIESQGRFFFVNDRNDDLHNIKTSSIVYAPSDPFTQEKMIQLELFNKTQDITNYSGFLDIITQTPCTVLRTKGRSSIEMTINDYFHVGDYIEVRWENYTESGGYPLRWKIIANDNALSAGDVWPTYAIDSDSDGEFYYVLFHPGDSSIKLTQFVKTIETAFNTFDFKNFEILAKNTSVYIRSKEDGVVSNDAQLKFSFSNTPVTIMGITAPNTGIVNFMGGSDRKFTRAKIDKNVANGMGIGEYISTEGNFSKAKQYTIFNDIIISAPYLEEPVYNSSGILTDFTGAEYYHAVVLDNENQKIRQTYDHKLTSYELFKPSYGILSIFPFKDFDVDFHESDYSRSYTPELIEYFGRFTQPLTIEAISTSPYIFTFDRGVTFDSYPTYVPFLGLTDGVSESSLDMMLRFDVAGSTAAFIGSSIPVQVDQQILLMPDNKSLYFQEEELSRFKGFIALSSVVDVNSENIFRTMENLWDPKRFTFQLLDSEYDRLSENLLKTNCLKSRVVPYISKWVADGKNIRDDDYRFNYDRAFGVMNFTPSTSRDVADPRFHTHEWAYLDSFPHTYPVGLYPEYSFSYMFDKLDDNYDFSSVKRDWFSKYFNVGYPTELCKCGTTFTNHSSDISQRYSVFKYEDFTNKTFTLFRGQKVQIDSDNPSKYDGYKYSVILKTQKSILTDNEDPINFKTIINEKWKFIVTIITLKVSSYRFPNGNLSYTDLYTLDNSNIVVDSESSLGYTYKVNLPNDFKLSEPLDLSTFPGKFKTLLSGDSYVTDLTEEIYPLSSGVFSNLLGFSKPSAPTKLAATMGGIVDVFNDGLTLSSYDIFYKYSYSSSIIQSSLPSSAWDWEDDFIFYHRDGGNNALLGIRDRLSFSEVSKVIMGESDKSRMVYQIYDKNGNLTTSATDNLSFTMISPETITKMYDYFPISDPDKPDSLFTYPEIGVNLERFKNLQTLYRYQGGFSPKFKDVLKFWVREDEDFSIAMSKDFMLCNTHLGVELTEFSVIKNEYYNKVSDNEILSIAPDSGYLPVYPFIGEIAIDRKDFYAWSSSWDDNYYRYYSSTTDFEEKKGTESMKEIKSLFGSKSMKVPDTFDLYQFKTEELESETLVKNSETEFSFVDLTDKCLVKVNLYDRLLREMLGTSVDINAKAEFLRAHSIIPDSFSASEIEDKTREYLVENIMNLYEINRVDLYVLQTGMSDTDQIATTQSPIIRPVVETISTAIDSEIFDLTLSETDLINKSYLIKRDTKIYNVKNLEFEFQFKFDSRYYTSISLGVSVKRI